MPALGYYPKVKDGQFRRIVRFLKWFSRSRPSWSLPGGLIISALAAEVYVKDDNRDDRALYDTIVALANRLNGNTKVYNPVTWTEFTENTEIQSQVDRLKKQINMAVTKLSPLFDQQTCTREKARSAWDWVFNHSFWAEKEKVQKAASDEAVTASALMPYYVKIKCELVGKGGKAYREYASGGGVLQKNTVLKFSLLGTNVPQPYLITWIKQNEGDEAAADDALYYASEPSHDYTHLTSTAYKGNHRMVCKITKNGTVVAQTSHLVRIGAGKWWRGFK